MPKNITAQSGAVKTGIDKALDLEKGYGVETSQAQRELLNDIDYESIVIAHCENDATRVGITLTMARKLSMDLPPCGTSYWFQVGHNENTVQGKLVTPIKKQVFAELKARKHSNPSTAWAQYREAGRELVFGKRTPTEQDPQLGGVRKFDVRVEEECSKLYLAYNQDSTDTAIKDLSQLRRDRIEKSIPLLEQLLVAITGKAGICAKLIADRDAAK